MFGFHTDTSNNSINLGESEFLRPYDTQTLGWKYNETHEEDALQMTMVDKSIADYCTQHFSNN